jgi:hypothetical protein
MRSPGDDLGRPIDVVGSADLDASKLDREGAGCWLQLFQEYLVRGPWRVEDGYSAGPREGLPEEFEPLHGKDLQRTRDAANHLLPTAAVPECPAP